MTNLSHSSGFVSAPSNASASDHNGRETDKDKDNDSSGGSGSGSTSDIDTDESSSVSAATIGSFKSFVENHTQPFARDYDLFATSYLCQDVPFDHIICDDSDSYKDIEIKFVQPVPIQKYFIQEKCRKDFGPSIRKKLIIPSTHLIWKEIEKGQKNIQDVGLWTKFLYTKARQWCEVNKALVMDHKYPKPDANVVRQKYSSTHQTAIKLVRKDMGLEGKREPIFKPENVRPYSKPMAIYFLREMKLLKDSRENKDKDEIIDIFIGYDAGTELNHQEQEKWNVWRNTLQSVFAEITPLTQLQTKEKHWQSKAIASQRKTSRHELDVQQKKTMKKRFWKRNMYPPMTMEDRIAAKRKLLPPLKPDGLDVDYLSGIWQPELMLDDFVITPLNYDSRVDVSKDGPDPISWWDAHKATQKCWMWLKNIPDNL